MILLTALLLMDYIQGQSGQPGSGHGRSVSAGQPGYEAPEGHPCTAEECTRQFRPRNCDCSHFFSHSGGYHFIISWAQANGYFGLKK